MKLIKIAFGNVKASIGLYKLYLLSLIFSVLLFFSFVSLKSNPMVEQLEGVYIFNSLVAISLIVMMIFVFFFLMFSTKFFIAERKKEIGLYVMTGAPKKKIALMVAMENMMMYLLAIVIGSILGLLLNKFFVMIVVNFLNMGITIDFYVSFKDLAVTSLVFLILGILTSLRGFVLVNKKKVLDLLKGKAKEESMPKGNIPIGVLSLIVIGCGYHASMQMNSDGIFTYALIAVSCVIVGTFLFYRSVMSMLLKGLMKQERLVYKKNRLLIFSNLWYRIGNNYKVYAAVTIFLTCTLTAISTAASFSYSYDDIRKVQYPYSIYIEDDEKGSGFDHAQEVLKERGSEIAYSNRSIESYRLEEVSNDVWRFTSSMTVISEDTYRRNMENIPFVTKNKVLPPKPLKDTEAYYANNPSSYITMGSVGKLRIGEDKLDVSWSKRAPIFGESRGDVIIVSNNTYDRLFEKYCDGEKTYFSGIQLVDDLKVAEVTDQLEKELGENITLIPEEAKDTLMQVIIKLFFIFGIFLGLAFILATGSIIYFKIVSQAREDMRTYELLHDMGMEDKKMKGVIHKQILMFFIIPLILGSVHTFAASRALERFLGISLLSPLGWSVGVIGGIFLVYFVMTVNRYKRIVL